MIIKEKGFLEDVPRTFWKGCESVRGKSVGKWRFGTKEELTDEKFELKVHIKNRNNGETILIDQLYCEDKIWDLATEDIGKIVEKQLNYALRYMPELETLFEDEDKLALELNLNEVYKIIAQTAYYLQKAQIEVILPEELTNIIIPRASINAKVKASRSDDLMNIFNTVSSSAISLDDILDFSYEVALGDEKISLEEFNKLIEPAPPYKGSYQDKTTVQIMKLSSDSYENGKLKEISISLDPSLVIVSVKLPKST